MSSGNDCTTGYLIDYDCSKNYHKMIAIDLSKQQPLGTDPKAAQQMNFTGNLDKVESAVMLFINEEAKGNILDF